MSIYLDNAATTHPKPPSVVKAVVHALESVGASPGRAAYRLAREASATVARTREKVALFLGISDINRVAFTKNATESINVVLKGWLRSGDRVLFSSMEHNAVVRPLHRLSGEKGIEACMIPGNPRGEMDMEALEKLLELPTRLIVLTHASNVHGALQSAPEIARVCSERGAPILLDAAQTAGVQPIAAEEWNIGMLACSAHKGLLGPPGVGILYIRPDLNVPPLMEGGTGSRSEQGIQPESSPDRYESGTLNLPAIAGLDAGVDYILERGIDSIRKHELELAEQLEKGLADLNGVRLFLPDTRGTGVVSFTMDGLNPGDMAHLLDEGFDMAVRAGLHCAPLAHRNLGSFPEGTVRVSPGYATTYEEIEQFLQAVRTLTSYRRR
jgi:cysteine desulfurase/selenocysteine lyase